MREPGGQSGDEPDEHGDEDDDHPHEGEAALGEPQVFPGDEHR